MPLSFAATLDGLWMLQSQGAEGFEVAHQAIHDLVKSVPVGADLSAVPGLTVYQVAYDSPWNVMQYFTGGPCRELVERVKGLHERERAHEVVSNAEWAPLKREAILCPELPIAGGSELLEELAGPLSSHPAEILGRLLMLARSDLRRFPGWSERDAARLDEIRMGYSAHIKSRLGPRPSEQGPELDRWFRNAEDIQKELTEQREREEPEFCARWTRWSNMQLQLRIDFLKSVSVIVQNHIDHVCGSL
jgi:hypothetical protein